MKLRQHWFNLTNDKRVQSLQVAADNLNELADRQRPAAQRRCQYRADSFENLILLVLLALIASALAYAYGTEVGQARCPLGNAVPPAVVR
jgi:hypothetical protein